MKLQILHFGTFAYFFSKIAASKSTMTESSFIRADALIAAKRSCVL